MGLNFTHQSLTCVCSIVFGFSFRSKKTYYFPSLRVKRQSVEKIVSPWREEKLKSLFQIFMSKSFKYFSKETVNTMGLSEHLESANLALKIFILNKID